MTGQIDLVISCMSVGSDLRAERTSVSLKLTEENQTCVKEPPKAAVAIWMSFRMLLATSYRKGTFCTARRRERGSYSTVCFWARVQWGPIVCVVWMLSRICCCDMGTMWCRKNPSCLGIIQFILQWVIKWKYGSFVLLEVAELCSFAVCCKDAIHYFLHVFLIVILVIAQLHFKRRFILKITFMVLLLENSP